MDTERFNVKNIRTRTFSFTSSDISSRTHTNCHHLLQYVSPWVRSVRYALQWDRLLYQFSHLMGLPVGRIPRWISVSHDVPRGIPLSHGIPLEVHGKKRYYGVLFPWYHILQSRISVSDGTSHGTSHGTCHGTNFRWAPTRPPVGNSRGS